MSGVGPLISVLVWPMFVTAANKKGLNLSARRQYVTFVYGEKLNTSVLCVSARVCWMQHVRTLAIVF